LFQIHPSLQPEISDSIVNVALQLQSQICGIKSDSAFDWRSS